MRVPDYVFMGIGGFLIGAVLYSGYYTTRYEPEVKYGYAIVGIGVIISVIINTWLDFFHKASDWFRYGTLLGYSIVALGLIIIIRERRAEYGKEAKDADSSRSD